MAVDGCAGGHARGAEGDRGIYAETFFDDGVEVGKRGGVVPCDF